MRKKDELKQPFLSCFPLLPSLSSSPPSPSAKPRTIPSALHSSFSLSLYLYLSNHSKSDKVHGIHQTHQILQIQQVQKGKPYTPSIIQRQDRTKPILSLPIPVPHPIPLVHTHISPSLSSPPRKAKSEKATYAFVQRHLTFHHFHHLP